MICALDPDVPASIREVSGRPGCRREAATSREDAAGPESSRSCEEGQLTDVRRATAKPRYPKAATNRSQWREGSSHKKPPFAIGCAERAIALQCPSPRPKSKSEDRNVERQLYFAYGSNMSPQTMESYSPAAKLVCTARAVDFRLRFSRRSTITGTGVADIFPAPGCSVWGVLYSVSAASLEELDRKEGVCLKERAYERFDLTVVDATGRYYAGVSYRVRTPTDSEILPSSNYLDVIQQAASERGLPPEYLDLLAQLPCETSDTDVPGLVTTNGLLVTATSRRPSASGVHVVRLNPADFTGPRRGWAAIAVDDRSTLAHLQLSPDVARGACEVDQNLRHALEPPGAHRDVVTAQVGSIKGPVPRGTLLKPRGLHLPLHQPNWLDSEKNICVLNLSNMKLLGVEEGDYVTIVCCPQQAVSGEERRIHRVTLRAFSGTASSRAQQRPDYPSVHEVYLDEEARGELGLPSKPPRAYLGYPLLVLPSVPQLLAKRAIPYGVTLFLGVSSIMAILEALVPGASRWICAVMAIAISGVFTFGLAVADLRGRLHY